MFSFFGGVPRLIVIDNLKSGVHKASFYDPKLNRGYYMMARTTVSPFCRPDQPDRRTRPSSRTDPLCPELHPQAYAPSHLLLAA